MRQIILLIIIASLLLVPAPAQAQAPALNLTVTTDIPAGQAVRPGQAVIYTVTLTTSGGSTPLETRITNTLPEGVALAGQPEARAQPAQAATPLVVQIREQTIGWRGLLNPNSTLQIRIPTRVETCWGGTRTLRNQAGALRPNGATVQSGVQLSVQCALADIDAIAVRQRIVRSGAAGWMPYDSALLPNRSFTLQTSFRNTAPVPVLLGVGLPRQFNPTEPLIDVTQATVRAQRIQYLALEPGAEGHVEHSLRADPRLFRTAQLTDDVDLTLSLTYCLIAGGTQICNDSAAAEPAAAVAACLPADVVQIQIPCPDPETPPNDTGTITTTLPFRPNDLGDAPDSSNHAGVAMEAYPGVQANFPTVFNRLPGDAPGPLHRRPQPVHLGAQVSLEAEADSGPDADPTNNLLPLQNQADNDRYDDGFRRNNARFEQCRPAELQVQVTLQSAAVKQALRDRGITELYLNGWVDGNRDGDWNDIRACAPNLPPAQEHFLVDFPIALGPLTPGPNRLTITANVPTLWLDDLANQPAWLRLTLSETPAPKLPQRTYGDGRGPQSGYRLGETEDYLLQPAAQADLRVTQSGALTRELPADVREAILGDLIGQYRITYTNAGDQPARNVTLTQVIEAFGGRRAELAFVQAPGLPTDAVRVTGDRLNISVGDLEPGATGAVVVGWRASGPAAGLAQSAEAYTARVEATATGTPSRTTRTTLAEATIAPSFTFRTAGSPVSAPRGITCRNSVELLGQGEPGAALQIGVGIGAPATNAVVDTNGRWSATLNNLATGLNIIEARTADGTSARAPLLVDPNLSFDPLSLAFSAAEQTFGADWRIRNGQPQGWSVDLPPGATSATVGVNRCGTGAATISLNVGGTPITLSDSDSDGRSTGMITLGGAATNQAGEWLLNVRQGALERSYSGRIAQSVPGLVSAQGSGLALSDATVTLLREQSLVGANSSATLNTAIDPRTGTPAVQTTASAGAYRFAPPTGDYRLLVTRTGYQPYRTRSISVASEPIAEPIRLTPLVSAEPNVRISIGDAGFSQAQIEVSPGAVIEWINLDIVEHTVTAADGTWDSGVLQPGERYVLRLNRPGAYSYSDDLNPLNSATITVTAAGPTTIYLPLVRR